MRVRGYAGAAISVLAVLGGCGGGGEEARTPCEEALVEAADALGTDADAVVDRLVGDPRCLGLRIPIDVVDFSNGPHIAALVGDELTEALADVHPDVLATPTSGTGPARAGLCGAADALALLDRPFMTVGGSGSDLASAGRNRDRLAAVVDALDALLAEAPPDLADDVGVVLGAAASELDRAEEAVDLFGSGSEVLPASGPSAMAGDDYDDAVDEIVDVLGEECGVTFGR